MICLIKLFYVYRGSQCPITMMHQEGKSSSPDFSIPLLVAFQTRHLSQFWYEHTNPIHTLQHPQPDTLGILNLFYFPSLLLELIVSEIADRCVPMHSCKPQKPGPCPPRTCGLYIARAVVQTQRAHTASLGKSQGLIVPPALSPGS